MITVEKAREWANKILKREREIQEDEVSAEMMQHMERRQALQEEIREFRESEKRKEEQFEKDMQERRELQERYAAYKGDPTKLYERQQIGKRQQELINRCSAAQNRPPSGVDSKEDRLVETCRDVDLQLKLEDARAVYDEAREAARVVTRKMFADGATRRKAEDLRKEALGHMAVNYGKAGQRWESYVNREGETRVRGVGDEPLHERIISSCNSGLLAQSNRLLRSLGHDDYEPLEERSDRLQQKYLAVREELIWSEV